jgi:hypothetical protein
VEANEGPSFLRAIVETNDADLSSAGQIKTEAISARPHNIELDIEGGERLDPGRRGPDTGDIDYWRGEGPLLMTGPTGTVPVMVRRGRWISVIMPSAGLCGVLECDLSLIWLAPVSA